VAKNNNLMNAKKISIAMIVFFFASSFSPAEIQPPAKFRIFLGAGLSFPSGYLNEKYKVGVGEGIEIDFRFHKNLSLFAGLVHTYTSYDIQTLDKNVYNVLGTEFACYGWFGGLKGIFPVLERLTLYALGGAGTCEQESGDVIFSQRRPGPGGGWVEETTQIYNVLREGYFFGLTAGVGLEYELSRWFALFTEIRIVKVFNTERKPPPEWAWLPPEVYQNPPNVVFFPLRIGLSFRI
jgi:hypothetical protein